MPIQYYMAPRKQPIPSNHLRNGQESTRRKTLLNRPPLTGGFTTPGKRSATAKLPTVTPDVIPENLFFITRAHFKIVKCTHHLDTLLCSVPPSLRKTARQLQHQLHPAFIDDEFKAAAQSLSEQWLAQVHQLMLSHYTKIQEEAENLILQHAIPKNILSNSLEIVERWAKKQLSRRLKSSNLEASLRRIQTLQPTTDSTYALPIQAPTTPLLCDISTQTTAPLSSTCDTTPVIASGELEPTCPIPTEACTSTAESITPSAMPPSTPQCAVIPTPEFDEPTPSTEPSNTAPQILKQREQDQTAKPLTQRPATSKKRTLDSCSLTQLDLFGDSLSSAPSPRRRLLNTPTWQKKIVCGDNNLSTFQLKDCLVLAHDRGRLSHYKDFFRSIEDPCLTVESFILVLSTLDKGNCFLSNQTSLKSVLGAARRLFPNAKCFVQLCGISDSFTQAEKDNLQDLNNYVILKSPSSCLHIPAPSAFVTVNNDHEWSSDTRSKVFESLKNFLN